MGKARMGRSWLFEVMSADGAGAILEECSPEAAISPRLRAALVREILESDRFVKKSA